MARLLMVSISLFVCVVLSAQAVTPDAAAHKSPKTVRGADTLLNRILEQTAQTESSSKRFELTERRRSNRVLEHIPIKGTSGTDKAVLGASETESRPNESAVKYIAELFRQAAKQVCGEKVLQMTAPSNCIQQVVNGETHLCICWRAWISKSALLVALSLHTYSDPTYG